MPSIGLSRTEVKLSEHDKSWGYEFEKERANLLTLIGDLAVDIQHVGSTSIPNICAKPIIDIAIGARNRTDMERISDILMCNGYILREESGDEHRIFMVRGSELCRTHYLHIQIWRSKSWFNQVYFRDVLREDPTLAKEYNDLKVKLQTQHPYNRTAYGKGKDPFIEKILSKLPEDRETLIDYSIKTKIPLNDLIMIELNKFGVNSDVKSPRIRTNFSLLNNNLDKFYLGLPNNKMSAFTQNSNSVFLYNIEIGKFSKIENDDCASSYFRKDGRVITLNSNSRSNCRGCKFCPNNLELNSEDKNLNTFDKLFQHLSNISNGNMSKIERLTICTGCFGSEDKTLEHILLVNSVAKTLNFNGVLHYIGSEITGKETMRKISKNVDSFMYTFTIECFSNRESILKNTKSNLSIENYIEFMDIALSNSFKVNYIYVLGIDDFSVFSHYTELLSKHVNMFPLINIFQPHEYKHWRLLSDDAHSIDYYIKARLLVENLYYNTDMRPNSWECYRPLWYFKFKDEIMNCTRI